ncbi:armadillo repeat-containing protein 7-like [Hibiscus syriacus]|uniref:armadillo repeat-containing protein 7-like n=1 Tax=Hibiscus syriacus TaxID=106335 RepID=UPI0019246FBF|nr:armadillo repeat-containing protein 7-like [Hibiscus syriacus]
MFWRMAGLSTASPVSFASSFDFLSDFRSVLMPFIDNLKYGFLAETKEKIAANLANFAYDPYNYSFMRQLNVLELFLDCITEPNEKLLVEFGMGGVCNSCVDPANAAVITQCGGIPLVVQCLSSPVRNTVNYALGALYYLCNKSNREEILKPEVIDVIERYAEAQTVNVSFSNLAKAFLDKHAC